MKSATSSPNARPWTLGKGRPIGTAEVPPIRSARPWVYVVLHGIGWESIVFRNKTRDFENDSDCTLSSRLPLVDHKRQDIRALQVAPEALIGCQSSPCPAIGVEAISHRRSSIFTVIVQRGPRRLGALDPVATRFRPNDPSTADKVK